MRAKTRDAAAGRTWVHTRARGWDIYIFANDWRLFFLCIVYTRGTYTHSTTTCRTRPPPTPLTRPRLDLLRLGPRFTFVFSLSVYFFIRAADSLARDLWPISGAYRYDRYTSLSCFSVISSFLLTSYASQPWWSRLLNVWDWKNFGTTDCREVYNFKNDEKF